jgi:hypothetical protein
LQQPTIKMHNTSKTIATISLLAVFIGFLGASPTPAQQVDPVGGKDDGIIIDVDASAAQIKFKAAHPATELYTVANRITCLSGRFFSQGTSPSRSAEAFLRQHAGIFGARTQDIVPFGAFPQAIHSVDVMWDEATQSFGFTLLGYSQVVEGIPVFRSALKLLMRNEVGFPLVLASADLRDLGDFPATLAVRPTLADFDQRVWSSEAIAHRALGEPQEAQLVIFAGVDETPAQPTLAVSFVVERGVPGTGYTKMLYVADAQTGKVLFSESQIFHADVSGTIAGQATQGFAADACNPEAQTGMPYARVTAGSTNVFANANGSFVVPNPGTGAVNVTSNFGVAGRYFKVADNAGPVSSLSQDIPSGGSATLVHNAANTDANVRAQVNAYLHANIARDAIMASNPSYPVIAGQQDGSAFQINVQVSGTCNAFYNGSSINFYPAGGGCNNTAFATVVHHEFGHHMVASAGSGQGAYGEGQSDVLSVVISESALLAIGFQSCSTGLRNADNNNQYLESGCSTAGSAIHTCGTLLSGCVWDTWLNMQAAEPANYRTIMRNLAVNSTLLHTGTGINSDITRHYLTLDDNNATLEDGTPHYAQINTGFSDHGMPGPAVSPLSFSVAGGIPTYADPSSTRNLTVTVSALAGQPQANTGRLFWRAGASGAFTNVAMTQGATNVYTASLPMGVCGSIVQYYFQAQTTTGATVTSPATAPTAVHTTSAGYGDLDVVFDNLETNTGWTAGITGDTATSGQWVRVDPIGTQAQPEDDYTPAPGTLCFVTGQGSVGGGLGEADIDGGVTTLMTPAFSLTTVAEPRISYARWYSNDKGASPNADSMPVQISNNNGATWVQLESVTENLNAWSNKTFRVADFVTPTATMRVRWLASDLGSGSLVEAGVDDFRVFGINCTPPNNPADLNNDGSINGTDLAIVLSAWGTAAGDVSGDGTTDGTDLTALLSAWTG